MGCIRHEPRSKKRLRLTLLFLKCQVLADDRHDETAMHLIRNCWDSLICVFLGVAQRRDPAKRDVLNHLHHVTSTIVFVSTKVSGASTVVNGGVKACHFDGAKVVHWVLYLRA